MGDWKDLVVAQLERMEAIKQYPYTDTDGKLTIGIGRNLTDQGISQDEIDLLLTNDLAHAEDDARALLSDAVFDGLSDVRKAVMVNMAFNLGLPRLRKFVVFLAAVKDGRYQDASAAMLDSKWAAEVKDRATELSGLMASG